LALEIESRETGPRVNEKKAQENALSISHKISSESVNRSL